MIDPVLQDLDAYLAKQERLEDEYACLYDGHYHCAIDDAIDGRHSQNVDPDSLDALAVIVAKELLRTGNTLAGRASDEFFLQLGRQCAALIEKDICDLAERLTEKEM